MRTWPERRKRHARIEIIPMIDVMMFLLVFFVLISINVLPSLGLHITPPTAVHQEQLVERKKVVLTIDKDGKTYLDGQPAALSDLPELLKAMQDAATADNKKMTVVIAGDTDSALQHLVDVLETLKLAGITSSAIATKPR